ncbi:MAG TPA: CehA/McbA family metallohydrolase [Clostridiaceae bacterium]|jgi:hypothetical protein|nr:CehA/McbA family metallohydrolase [Clostridiaceae bacterium]
MRDYIAINKNIPQWKGCVHMHTVRSGDSKCPYAEALDEYRKKGFDFCVMTDHQVYWNSDEMDKEDFLVLSGVEIAFDFNLDHPYTLNRRQEKHLHLNLIWDVTKGECGFQHGEVIKRPMDWGIDSWNQFIEEVKEKNQIVILNHPNWSHMDFELILALHGCLAFEVWNSGSVLDVGGYPDDAVWDYCLSRGKRIRAVAGDDTHNYGEEFGICGSSATIVCTENFSKAGIVEALKEGRFYPTTGPKIYDLRIVDGTLHLECSPASVITIVGGNGFGRSYYAKNGDYLNELDWQVNSNLNYFRIRVTDQFGKTAWSQPIMMQDLLVGS